MNNYVLRGFCQKCGEAVYFAEFSKGEWCDKWDEFGNYCGKHPSEPVWFLSPAQMRIVYMSPHYLKWWIHAKTSAPSNQGLPSFLEDNPFLVSTILKDAGEKNSKEENK